VKLRLSFVVAATVVAAAMSPLSSFGQSALTRFGAGVKASTLGIGVEGAAAVTERSNVRFGVNTFNHTETLESHGINYDAKLKLSSLQLTYDQYLIRGFHVSPGLLFHNGNKADATAFVPAGSSFSLGGTRYYSSLINPIGGVANVKVKSTAPMVLLGFGNLLPRSGRHFGVNVEGGVVFQGSPETTLSLTGAACAVSPTSGCANANADPIIQNNLRLEQNKLNDDLQPLKYYPVLSVGISWQFRGPAINRR
jgi:hypothetical protein